MGTQNHHTGRMKEETKKLKEIISKLDGEFKDLRDEVEKTQTKKDMFENRRDELCQIIQSGDENFAQLVQR